MALLTGLKAVSGVPCVTNSGFQYLLTSFYYFLIYFLDEVIKNAYTSNSDRSRSWIIINGWGPVQKLTSGVK